MSYNIYDMDVDDLEVIKPLIPPRTNPNFNYILGIIFNYNLSDMFKKYYIFDKEGNYNYYRPNGYRLIEQITKAIKQIDEVGETNYTYTIEIYIETIMESNGHIAFIKEMKRQGIDWKRFV